MKFNATTEEAFVTVLKNWIYYTRYKGLAESKLEAQKLIKADLLALKATFNTFYESVEIKDLSLWLLTKPMVHEAFAHGKNYAVGRAQIRLTFAGKMSFQFPDTGFVHPHATRSGESTCWGDYSRPEHMAIDKGLSSAILSIYNYLKFSKYEARMGSAKEV